MHAALAAMRPIEARVGLHEDGCRAVLVSAMRTTDHLVGAPQHERLIAASPNSLAALSGRSGVQLAIGLIMPMCVQIKRRSCHSALSPCDVHANLLVKMFGRARVGSATASGAQFLCTVVMQ